MRALVVGGGELGTALALSLISQGRDVALVVRTRECAEELRGTAATFRAFRPLNKFLVPQTLRVLHAAEEIDFPVNAAFVCTASAALARKDGPDTVGSVLERARQAASAHGAQPPQTVVLTRGLTADGAAPHEMLAAASGGGGLIVGNASAAAALDWARSAEALMQHDLVNRGVEQKESLSETLRRAHAPVSLVLAADNAVPLQARSLVAGLLNRESCVWLDTKAVSPQQLALVNACAVATAVAAGVVSNEMPGCASATAALFANAVRATEALLSGGGPLSAGAASEDDKLGAFLAANRSAPVRRALDPSLAAGLMLACTNQASREFAFGRRIAVNMQRGASLADAFATAPDRSASLRETLEGVYVHAKALTGASDGPEAMSRDAADASFFTVLIDAFEGVIRGSEAALALVAPRPAVALESARAKASVGPMAEALQMMDRAVESGKDFAWARNEFARILEKASK